MLISKKINAQLISRSATSSGPDHDDQESAEFAESILAQAAARHHILIHFHGVWKPTGWQRTYPNLMNHEGAINLEYLKWSDRCPPEHDLLMAFTRLIAGPMDYHLGGFRAVPRAQFKPRMVAPNVLGTRGHMLAMYVCHSTILRRWWRTIRPLTRANLDLTS